MPETMPTVNLAAALVILSLVLAILATWVGLILRLAFRLPLLPPNTPRFVPWGAGSVVLVIVAWLGLQITVPIVYIVAIRNGLPGIAGGRGDLGPGEQMTLSAVSNAFVLVLVILLLRLTSGATLRDFGIVATGFFRRIALGMVAYPLLAPVVFGVMFGSLLIWKKVPHPLENAIKLDHSPGMLAILALASVFFAPVVEELIFRGVLLGWLTRMILQKPRPMPVVALLDEPIDSPIPAPTLAEPGVVDWLDHDPHNPYAAPRAAIAPESTTEIASTTTTPTTPETIRLILANVAVSIIFAGLHYAAWPTPIPIFFLSMGLGLLYQRTGSLLSSIALHMTFNGVSTLLMILTLGSVVPKDNDPMLPEVPKVEIKPAPAIVTLDLRIFPEPGH